MNITSILIIIYIYVKYKYYNFLLSYFTFPIKSKISWMISFIVFDWRGLFYYTHLTWFHTFYCECWFDTEIPLAEYNFIPISKNKNIYEIKEFKKQILTNTLTQISLKFVPEFSWKINFNISILCDKDIIKKDVWIEYNLML